MPHPIQASESLPPPPTKHSHKQIAPAHHRSADSDFEPIKNSKIIGLSHKQSDQPLKNHTPLEDQLVNNSSILRDASSAANSIFHLQVQTVLYDTSTVCLRRILSNRVRSHMETLTVAELRQPDLATEEEDKTKKLWDLLPNGKLEITTRDISTCHDFAARVGNQWARVLQRQGYEEFAEIVYGLVKHGRFLEWNPNSKSVQSPQTYTSSTSHVLPSLSDQTRKLAKGKPNIGKQCIGKEKCNNAGVTGTNQSKSDTPINPAEKNKGINTNNEHELNNFILPYAALHSLRRYPPDCDGSGKPSKYLPVSEEGKDSKDLGRPSAARKVIEKIDRMAGAHANHANGSGRDTVNRTMWYHGWDAICEAARRNVSRLDNNTRRSAAGEVEYEIVPKDGLMGESEDGVEAGGENEDREGDGGEVGYSSDVESGENKKSSHGILKTQIDRSAKKRKRSLPSKVVRFRGESSPTTDGRGSNNSVRDEDQNDATSTSRDMADTDFLLSTNSTSAAVWKKRRRRENTGLAEPSDGGSCDDGGGSAVESDDETRSNMKSDEGKDGSCIQRGRPPSTMEETALFSFDDVLSCMTKEERRALVISYIHPPFPFEKESEIEEGTNLQEEQATKEDHDESNGLEEKMISDLTERKKGQTEDRHTKTANEIPRNADPIPTEVSVPSQKEDSIQEDPPHKAIICGALKKFGAIHLWEQTRDFPNTNKQRDEKNGFGPTTNIAQHSDTLGNGERGGKIYGAAEIQASFYEEQRQRQEKKAMRKAVRERIGRRTVVLADQRADYLELEKCTKIKWTENNPKLLLERDSSGVNGGSDDAEQNEILTEDQSKQRKQWLEMDLGECMMEVVLANADSEMTNIGANGMEQSKKKMMAFRSLELALQF